jgi:CubicO group peptidase (beta-lactamase class C family)
MLETRRKGPGFEQALGWWVMKLRPGDRGFVTHGGGTFGYSNTVAYDPETRVGVVALSNCIVNDGGLAWHILMRGAASARTRAAGRRRR